MTFLQDFLSLIAGAMVIFVAKDRAVFAAVLAAGLGLAGLCWWACSVYSHLWNKRFKVGLVHHVMCGLAALITLVATVVFVTLKHTAAAAGISVEAWKIELGLDKSWADQTFKTAYDRVRILGLEDFSHAPPPPSGSTIPATHEKSQIECAWTYAGAAANHFNLRRPYLASIASASANIPRDVLRDDIRQHFATIGNTYPTNKAITLVGREVKGELGKKLPRVVSILRIQLIAFFLACQLIPFGLVGWAAYRDLKART